MTNPYKVVEEFERTMSTYCGSRYAVAVESGTAAIFLSLQYAKQTFVGNLVKEVEIPKFTYPSVPMSAIHAGYKVKFTDEVWESQYEIAPLKIIDAALKAVERNIYIEDTFYCLSFHAKKYLAIGRGGMILLDDEKAYNWLKKARFDGRDQVPLEEQKDLILGWNMYMTPEQAARGLMLFQSLTYQGAKPVQDLKFEDQGYLDCSQYDIFK